MTHLELTLLVGSLLLISLGSFLSGLPGNLFLALTAALYTLVTKSSNFGKKELLLYFLLALAADFFKPSAKASVSSFHLRRTLLSLAGGFFCGLAGIYFFLFPGLFTGLVIGSLAGGIILGKAADSLFSLPAAPAGKGSIAGLILSLKAGVFILLSFLLVLKIC